MGRLCYVLVLYKLLIHFFHILLQMDKPKEKGNSASDTSYASSSEDEDPVHNITAESDTMVLLDGVNRITEIVPGTQPGSATFKWVLDGLTYKGLRLVRAKKKSQKNSPKKK